MKKIFIVLISFLFTFSYAYGQQVRLNGLVIEADNSPVQFANVVLRTIDSVFVTGASTDNKGKFQISNIPSGDYRLIISSVGYREHITELMGLSQSIDLGVLILQEDVELLSEVTVTASSIVNQSDRKIVFPTEQQVKSSTNGVGLLQTMMLPKIQVNAVMNSVSLIGDDELQFRINGVQVTNKEISALLPQDIVRIEYLENPGLRYGNAEVVLNYITRRYETGGSVMTDIVQSPQTLFNNIQTTVRLNHKKSEFGLSYLLSSRGYKEYWRDNEEKFVYEDGSELIRQEIGQPGKIENYTHNLSFNYNYQPSEKSYLNVTLNYAGFIAPHDDFVSILRTNRNGNSDIQMSDFTDKKNHRPSLDIYYSKSLKNKQTFVFNVVGTYNNTQQERTYQEILDNQYLTNVLTNVDGDKYSIIGEGIYEKNFDPGRLSLGIKHAQSLSENNYTGTISTETKMKQADTYAYAEYAGKVEKLDYTVGVGVNRSWIKQEDYEDYETYSFKPRVSLRYAFSRNFYARLNGRIDNVSPALGELSAVSQWIDSLQIRIGNPDLASYNRYQVDLYAEYQFKHFALVGTFLYNNAPKAIMESTYRDNNIFIRTYENQTGWQKINSSLTLRSGLLLKTFQLSLTGGVNKYWSDGLDYSHQYTNWYGNAQLMAMYKKWMAMFQVQTNWNHFWGESVYGGENIHAIMLMYTHKNLTVGGGVTNPFVDNFKIKSENRNKYASYNRTSYVNETSRLFVFRLAWNFNYGRKYNAGQKKLNNSDTDAGIINTGK
ncbi:TonB-dependent receptor family protein [Parabacteroides sp. OttesenSCG-928-G07]|nr:TonB-dependent receptor family protein [Parabacteroides sp. OttesenSCG-928-G07]